MRLFQQLKPGDLRYAGEGNPEVDAITASTKHAWTSSSQHAADWREIGRIPNRHIASRRIGNQNALTVEGPLDRATQAIARECSDNLPVSHPDYRDRLGIEESKKVKV